MSADSSASAATASSSATSPARGAGGDARQRTQSMAQRMSKQPLSEGFDLWDRGYVLGAMRLFTFKAENAPPFQVGQILDAMAHLLLQLEEFGDAKDNFNFAAEKYDLIQQPILAKIMAAKAIMASSGTEAAFVAVEEAIKQFDGDKVSFGDTLTHKTKPPYARLYHFRAHLLQAMERLDEAIVDVKHAIDLGYDRVHLSYVLLGQLEEEKGNESAALPASPAAIAKNPNIVAAYLPLAMMQKKAGKVADAAETLEKAIALHPRAIFLRQKAYLMSESGKVAEALAFLDECIASPPHEEAEAIFSAQGSAVADFHKAKAAVLADAGKFDDAIAAAKKAAELSKDDEEAASMIRAIEDARTAAASPQKA